MTHEESSLVRTFIAIPIDKKTKDYLSENKTKFSRASWQHCVRWVCPDNLHITLRFIGVTTQQQLSALIPALRKQLGNQQSFAVTLSSVKPFPGPKKPRVLAAYVSPSRYLDDVVASIEDVLSGIGMKREQRLFRGHVTVARCKNCVNTFADLLRFNDKITLSIDTIVVYASRLSPTGVEYTELAAYRLKPNTSVEP